MSRLQEWCLAFSAVSTFSYQGGIRHFQAVARVLEAEENIVVRLQALVDTPNADAERQAIENALASLRVLKRDSLGFPDWEKK